MANKILTTHVGSLPRSQEVVDYIFARERGGEYDKNKFATVMSANVDECVARQVKAGIDIVSDGDTSRFLTRPTSKTVTPGLPVTAQGMRPPI